MAQTIETHYDRLKVMRDAPLEVIKASYRALSQKYHPDRNPDPDAARVMALINQAWDALSDPDKRATHDRWIESQEREPVRRAVPPSRPRQGAVQARQSWLKKYQRPLAGALVLLGLGAGIVSLQRTEPMPAVEDGMVRVEQGAPSTGSERAGLFGEDPDAKPAAMPWEIAPAKRLPHGYLEAERQFFADGLSSFEIDNSSGDKDADVRLYRNGRVVRSMFVHQGRRFVAGKLTPGGYVLKYQVAIAGKMHAYQVKPLFQLNQEIEEDANGKRFDKFTRMRVSMSDVASGKLPVEEIPLDQI